MRREHKLFYRHLAQTSPFPLALEVDRAEGMYMVGQDGKRYLDLISGIGVSNIGHRHPEVVAAVKAQLEKHMHLMVYGEFIQAPQVRLAALLAENLPPSLDNVYLVNSGSEAVEGALKLAKRHTGRFEMIAFRNAYHGSTQGALSVTGDESLKQAFRPLLPGIRFLDYDCPDQLDRITDKTACVIMEPIQGEAGARVPSVSFVREVRRRCQQTGALLIFDEIQTGFGRSGALWAFEHTGVLPDILLLGKAMGGGLPIAAFIAAKELMQDLSHDPVLGHITTFGGNAVCAAAALANLEVILRGRLWEEVPGKEALFRSLLRHPDILEIRGKGLLLAVTFQDFETNRRIIGRCLEQGLLTDWFLFASHCMRIAPPLLITADEIRRACRIILASVAD